MDKKSNKYKKLEQEIVYIQQKLNEIIKSRHDRLEDGIVIFKPTEGLTLDDWKKFIDNEKLLDWNAITLKGDVTPTLFEFYNLKQDRALLQNPLLFCSIPVMFQVALCILDRCLYFVLH
jgi:hypothetical protein